jgi:DNA-binding response OmpR family regulator
MRTVRPRESSLTSAARHESFAACFSYRKICQVPKILIVDDEDSIRDALARWFTLRGYEVEKAEDGLAAVEKCAVSSFDIITMDLEMPRLSGMEAIERIRKTNPTVPIIVLTGYPNEAEEVLERGAAKVLTKPLRLRDLEEEVSLLLTRGGN